MKKEDILCEIWKFSSDSFIINSVADIQVSFVGLRKFGSWFTQGSQKLVKVSFKNVIKKEKLKKMLSNVVVLSL